MFTSLFILFVCYYLPSPPPLFKRNLCYKTCPYNKGNDNPIFDTIDSAPLFISNFVSVHFFDYIPLAELAKPMQPSEIYFLRY